MSVSLNTISRVEHSVRGERDAIWLHDTGVPIPRWVHIMVELITAEGITPAAQVGHEFSPL